MKLRLAYTGLALTAVLLGACSDPKAITDQNTEIVNNNWAYGNKLKFPVKVENADISYNLCFNLRVTADYKYSNIFILVHEDGPGMQPSTVRYEFTLANATGEWYGAGSGNIYTYQVPFKKGYKFPAKGNYIFEIEQNMRDNPLREVSDVGLRVEKAQ